MQDVLCEIVDSQSIKMTHYESFPSPEKLLTITIEGLTNPRSLKRTERFEISTYDTQENMIEFGLLDSV